MVVRKQVKEMLDNKGRALRGKFTPTPGFINCQITCSCQDPGRVVSLVSISDTYQLVGTVL